MQLTSLINGWGLTDDGLCCSPHNHIRNVIIANTVDSTAFDDPSDDSAANHADRSGNKLGDDPDASDDGNVQEKGGEEEGEEEEEGEGEEWGCREECRTFLRVCLSHLQDPLPSGQTLTLAYMCTFGSAASPVLGGNTLDPFGTWEERLLRGRSVDPDTLVGIPFTFSWPVSTSEPLTGAEVLSDA